MTATPGAIAGKKPASRTRVQKGLAYLNRTWMLYLMLVLPTAFFVLFRYVPMAYIWMAFSDFNIFTPVFEAEFVGLAHFRNVFSQPRFFEAVRNTLYLNILELILGFPAPILLALLLNELKFRPFKRFTQTVLYMPHFLSWIVVYGMAVQLFAGNMGLVNDVLARFGFGPIHFLTNTTNWVRVYIGSGIWKGAGWGTIIYLAAIAGINQELYEAASVDGAGRFKKIINITIPCIMPTVVIILILNIGGMIGIELDRPWAFRNALVLERAEVLSTFVYQRGILSRDHSFATAVGLFQSVVNIVLLFGANFVAKRLGERGLF